MAGAGGLKVLWTFDVHMFPRKHFRPVRKCDILFEMILVRTARSMIMRSILNLNDNWIFLKGVSDVPAVLPEEGEKVNLPHTWNGVDGQDGGNDYFRGACCYVKKLSKGELPGEKQCYLEICGANSSADVYLDGRRLAHHDGGYSTWRVNLTGELAEENLLAVVVDNAPNDDVYPQTADFTFYGGSIGA